MGAPFEGRCDVEIALSFEAERPALSGLPFSHPAAHHAPRLRLRGVDVLVLPGARAFGRRRGRLGVFLSVTAGVCHACSLFFLA